MEFFSFFAFFCVDHKLMDEYCCYTLSYWSIRMMCPQVCLYITLIMCLVIHSLHLHEIWMNGKNLQNLLPWQWVCPLNRHPKAVVFTLRCWILDRSVWLAKAAVCINNGGTAGYIYSNSGGWRRCEWRMIYDSASLTTQPPACLLARPLARPAIAVTNKCRNSSRRVLEI